MSFSLKEKDYLVEIGYPDDPLAPPSSYEIDDPLTRNDRENRSALSFVKPETRSIGNGDLEKYGAPPSGEQKEEQKINSRLATTNVSDTFEKETRIEFEGKWSLRSIVKRIRLFPKRTTCQDKRGCDRFPGRKADTSKIDKSSLELRQRTIESDRKLNFGNNVEQDSRISRTWRNLKRQTRQAPVALDDFLIGMQMGQGQEATVWEAHPRPERRCARTLPYDLVLREVQTASLDACSKAQVRRGFKIHSKVCVHPNIVQVYWSFSSPSRKTRFEVLQCLDGKTLDLVSGMNLWNDLKMAEKEYVFLTILKQVLSAIAYMHTHGFSHGDVKPENIFVSRDPDAGTINVFENIKLIDFGYAQSWNAKDGEKTTLIEPNYRSGYGMYIAPEVYWESHSASKADVFSMGAVLYFLITGRPFGSLTEEVTNLALIKHKRVSFPDPIWQTVSQDTTRLIAACMNFNPELRPSATEALAEVETILNKLSGVTDM